MIKLNNISGLQAFQLIRYSSLLIISIIFAKIGISNIEIGNYETFMFIVSAITFFWISGLIQALLPLYEKDSREILYNSALLLFIFSLLSVLFLLIFSSYLNQLFSTTNNNWQYLLYIFIIINSPTLLIEYIYILIEKPKNLIFFTIINYSLLIISTAIIILLKKEIIYSIICFVAVSILRFIWLLIILRKYSLFKFSLSFIKKHLKLGYPLVFSTLISSAGSYFDNFLINLKYNAETFAIYRYGAREFPLVMILANAFSNALIPEFNKKQLNDVLSDIKTKSLKLMHLLFPITIFFLLISNWAFPLIFNKSFAASSQVFNIYLLIIVSRLIFPQTILIGLKKTNYILIASIVESIVHIILSLIFVEIFGIIGVAYATVISYIIEKLVLSVYLKIKIGITPDKYLNYKWLFVYIILLSIAYLYTIYTSIV